ncbi:sigma-70 family RNA polymerase sigma factor [Emcibacter nanhaiensis]|uniref:Sigma-70 family RNA polymerase sigma factor n=2 Tax=Emcibacter nanhaiensis TaxID=1505037 RepID=A0A501PHL9_9PROT|nr:sigma-70 family RNA polymerase sigma factor [Emcibacter nanhaiensis]
MTPEKWRDEIVALLPRLRRFSFALTSSAADADDLLQATIEKALSKYSQFQAGTDLDKWLFRMCKNTWIDEWRSRQVRGPSVDPMDFRSELLVDGEQELVDRLSLSELNTALNKLQEDQKVLIALVAIEGHTYKEASEILEIPVGTVMSRLARARNALQDLLQNPDSRHSKGADNET